MCLAIPMKIIQIGGEFAEVETNGLRRTINIQMLKQPKIGDFVLVHAGFAIEKLDPQIAKETLKLIDETQLFLRGERGIEKKEELGEVR